ncbi:MAG: DUF3237 domain-containing protein [Acidobacteriota bacterium]
MTEPQLDMEYLFELRVKLDPPIESAGTPEGHRMVVIAESGTVSGPRLNGRVLPRSGGDWARVRSDGSGALDVRLSLETDDGAIVHMTYGGRMMPLDGDFDYALDFSKPDDREGASRYYFRTNPLFETGDARYAWLNHTVCIGKGRTGDGGVIYEVFAAQ